MKVFIKGISYYLPEVALTNEQLVCEFPEWTAEKISSKIGIAVRHISAPDETALDMACSASETFFLEHSIDKADIDFILLCTQSPDYFLPTSACILQKRLGLSKKCGALDFNLGCSGYVYGLALAKGLILSSVAQNILLITTETYTKHIHPRDRSNRTIFGDAAAVTIVSNQGKAEILDFVLGTDGSGFESLIVRNGAMRNHLYSGENKVDDEGNIIAPDNIYMNGADVFAFTIREIPKLVHETIAKNNLKQEDIDLYVFHQANQYMLEHLRKKLRIENEKFFIFMENIGNTVSSTIPIALYEAEKRMELYNKIVLLAGFGVGLSWGGVVLKY